MDTLTKSTKEVAEVASVLGRNFQTVELERARLLLEQAPEWVCQLRSYAQLAHAHYGMGRTPQATALAASGLNVLRQHQGPPLLVSSVDALMSLAHVHIEQALVAWHRAQLLVTDRDQRALWLERARLHFAQLGSVLHASVLAPG